MRTLRLGLGVAALVLAACTTGDGDAEVIDRLVIVDLDERAVTLDPDGADPVVISAEDEIAFQPIWSPDSSRVAYVSITDGGVAVADIDASSRQHIVTTISPFFLHWSPDGERIAALRNSPTGIALELVSALEDELSTTVLDTGAPYYLSWAPAGDRLIVHVGIDRLDLLEINGEVTSLDIPPGLFLAPQWTERGIVTARLAEGVGELVIVRDGAVRVVGEHPGAVTFASDGAGRRIAVQPVGGGPGGGIIDAALGPVLDEPLATDRLQVIDVASGEVSVVTNEPSVAFFWSPDGQRLLILEVADEGLLEWSTWSDGELLAGPQFGPADAWVESFLPFSDQYARSMTLWSPDSSAFAFPGERDGESGIWVHDLTLETTTKVADGTWVAWSHS